MNRTLLLLACLGVTAPLNAQNSPASPLAARTQAATRVVVAQVRDVQSRFATNRFGDQLIVSDVVLDVTETLKGPAAATMRVAVEGGTVGDLTLKVSDLPSFKPGDRAVFFLNPADGTLVPHDRGRGVLKVAPNGLIEGSTVTLEQVRREVVSAVRSGR
jgi:hypothetical protein